MRIGISHDFFAKGLLDYADWHWAWLRELCQNGIDANSTVIKFTVSEQDGNTQAIVENDGPPMSEEVLLEKFLCLGGTTKNFEGVGGFGIAKTVIALAHKSYRIETGDNVIVGSGGDFEHSKQPYFAGTRTTVIMAGHQKDKLQRAFMQFVSYGQWGGNLVWNGESHKADLRKGSPRRDLGFGMVYTNKSHRYRMVVRMHGMPMFVEYTGLDRCVVVELNGKSSDVMTSNRDGMVNPFARELTSFVTELSVDKRSALKRNKGPKYTYYCGTKLVNSSRLNVADVVQAYGSSLPAGVRITSRDRIGVPSGSADHGVIDGVSVGEGEEDQGPVYHEDVDSGSGVHAAAYTGAFGATAPKKVATLGTNFVLKSEVDLKTPAHFDPGSGEFSSHSMKLTRIWGRIMVELHRLFDVEAEFSIGFIMSEDCVAEFESGTYGNVYYLNPAKVVEQLNSASKSFKKRWKLTDRGGLIATAVHEFVHGLGCGSHDERFSSKYTDLMGRVLTHVSKFAWCFK